MKTLNSLQQQHPLKCLKKLMKHERRPILNGASGFAFPFSQGQPLLAPVHQTMLAPVHQTVQQWLAPVHRLTLRPRKAWQKQRAYFFSRSKFIDCSLPGCGASFFRNFCRLE
eukprot:337759-Pelagomonas_calceolata.AAC.1